MKNKRNDLNKAPDEEQAFVAKAQALKGSILATLDEPKCKALFLKVAGLCQEQRNPDVLYMMANLIVIYCMRHPNPGLLLAAFQELASDHLLGNLAKADAEFKNSIVRKPGQ